VGNQVNLQKADALLVPGRPGPYLGLDERARLCRAETEDELEPKRLQPTIDGGGAHRQ
jgi:hypothetical protein